jgi:hypothetical protein
VKTDWAGVGDGIALIVFSVVPYLFLRNRYPYSSNRKKWGMTDKTFDRLLVTFTTLVGIGLIILGVLGK